MERKCKGQRGLTLIEVIVSLAILGLIIAPLSAFFANSFKYNNLAKEQMGANQLAQKYMEEYKSKSFSELISLIGTITKSDDIGIDRFATEIKVEPSETPGPAPLYNATFNLTSTDSGKTLQLIAGDSGITFNDILYPFTPAEPITVLIKQVAVPADNIRIVLKNTTDYTLHVTEIIPEPETESLEDKLILEPSQGKIVITTLTDEEDPEFRYQEAGITITVTVTPVARAGNPSVKPTILSQIKKIT